MMKGSGENPVLFSVIIEEKGRDDYGFGMEWLQEEKD
jgi:phenylpyruvate tautomerase PptA (4-oxalocrotonate tautomerase family)